MLLRPVACVATVITTVLVIAACGGGGDGGGDSSFGSSSGSAVSTGVFIDSPVVNIGYRTETRSGVTNAQGEYKFMPGETVTFFIGDLEFPPVPASGVVTPLELAGTSNVSDPAVVNMIRLLQTLDKDGDPDTVGIEITDIAKVVATPVDFSQPVAVFEGLSAVLNLIANAGQDAPVSALVDEAVATSHFRSVLDGLAVFPIDLTSTSASSVITYSECPGVAGGWTTRLRM